jgi:hypothetical protein
MSRLHMLMHILPITVKEYNECENSQDHKVVKFMKQSKALLFARHVNKVDHNR